MNVQLQDMLINQNNIIQAIFYSPEIMSKYIHYRGSSLIKFKGASINIPDVPLIPYNSDICCLINKIRQNEDTSKTCKGINAYPLGPRGKVGVPYIIRDSNGVDTVVKLSETDNLYSTYRIDPPTPILNIDFNVSKYCITNIKLDNIRYIASDEFTNETLIAYILNYLKSQVPSLPLLFVRHYQGAVCSNTDGTTLCMNIMENCDLGPLDKISNHPFFMNYIRDYNINDYGVEIILPLIDSNTILQILIQITVGLHMLQTYVGFVSGDLKAGNIFIKSDPINIIYDGIKLQAPFTCKIADYGKSSCMLIGQNNMALRFYNESTLSNLYLSLHPFNPDVSSENGEYYYTIGNLLNSQIYTRTRHMGIPFFKSFDYYTVIVSLLTNPSIYYMFFSNNVLKSIFWDSIWFNDDGSIAMDRIRQYIPHDKGHSINDALDILKGLRLKCNAVAVIMNNIRHL
jgi:hypothetical protein